HQLPNLGGRRWPSWPAALMAVVLPGDEMPMPGEQGVRAHDGFELLEHAVPQTLRLGGQPNALVVGEPGTALTELLSKDAILGLEIVDHLALLLVDPAGQGDEEKPQRVRNWNHRAQPIKEAPRRHSGGRSQRLSTGCGRFGRSIEFLD